jgi:hypothetical protein
MLTDNEMRDLVKECGLDWHRGYMPLFDGDQTNRYAVLIEAATAPLLARIAEMGAVRESASRLVEHADFKLGGCLSADSKAKDIPSNAVSSVKARHLASLRDALAAMKEQP